MKPSISLSAVKSRRQKLLKAIGDGVLILPAASEQTRNRDCNYPFRQDSDFWYLSHFDEPGAILVLDGKAQTSIIFSKPYDKQHVIWEGEIIGQDKAKSRYLFDEALPLDDFQEALLAYLYTHETIVSPFSRYPDFDQMLLKLVKQTKDTRRAKTSQNWLHTDQFIHPMRQTKDADEIEIMQYAADISVNAHMSAMQNAQPNMNESEISALFDYHFAKAGGSAAYNHIVAGGNNACTLHYTVNNCKLLDGDLLLIDAGCEIGGYASDITRTFPANGKFTDEQKKVYSLVLKAMEAAFGACEAGQTIRSPHFAAEKVLIEGMLELGLVNGSVESVLKDKAHRRYSMHGTSHWLGLDVHDVGEYKDENDNWFKLEPGMIITVEPGIYIRKDDAEAPKALRGIGIRLEDNLLITENGYENLTKALPISITDIETICSQKLTPTEGFT